ncbi:hypothetical protein D3C73_446340 [compost metagenome]
MRRTLRQIDDPQHVRACRNDVVEADDTGATATDLGLAFAIIELQCVGDGGRDPFRRDRLDDEIESPCPHGLNDIFDAALSGLHDDRGLDAHLAQCGEEGKPVHFRHHQVEHDDIHIAAGAAEKIQRDLPVFGQMRDITLPLDCILQKAALNGIVIDDKDMSRHL